jgi:hypothetical protein
VTEECLGAVISLIEQVYGLQFGPERKRAWFLLLADLTDDEAQRAVIRVCRTSPHPPKPADIIRAARGSPKDTEVLLDEEAELAIRHLEQHVSDHRVVDLGPVLNAVVRAMGGPDAVCMALASGNWKYRRAEAARIYRALRRQGVSAEEAQPVWPLAVAESEAARGNWRVDPEAFPPPQPVQAQFRPQRIPGLPAPPGPRAPVLPA